MTTPNTMQREVLVLLRSGEWRRPVQLHKMLTDDFLQRLIRHGWIEQHGFGATQEVRITEVGLQVIGAGG